MHLQLLNAILAVLAIKTTTALPQQPSSPRATPPLSNDQLIAALKTDATTSKQLQRLVTSNSDTLLPPADLAAATVFDFNKNKFPVPGGRGSASSATLENFPLLLNSGLTTTVGTIGPCGFVIPHVHPRANEFFLLVEGEVFFGTQLELGVIKPNASSGLQPPVTGTLNKMTATLFPQGSIHYQVNNATDCGEATIVVTLSSEDPGTNQILLQGGGTAGGNGNGTAVDGLDGLRGLLPAVIVEAVDECLARCGGK
ncbi:hypothetical protein CC80DRAFT_541427 [Byssothecium circinans]|uniref:Cupin type-1 domain-containing protein n=1 Tax=Byssothecium circinans TaxID=147558 RepID=A0A6A5UE66_9PLEO|nr:hypothetical protein CC80DRAFT_541427 [Byssothecium circinans]